MNSSIDTFCKYSALFLLFLGLPGCGDNVREGLGESQKVEAAIQSLGDAAGSEATFKAAFVDGAAPSNRQAYASAIFEIVGEPSVSGDSSTATVAVTPGVTNSQMGDGAGKGNNASASTGTTEVEWQLQEVDGEWKLKDAPLQ